MGSLTWIWSSMKGMPVSGPSPRRTDTLASAIRVGRIKLFVPSDLYSTSSYSAVTSQTQQFQGRLTLTPARALTCCKETNSASIETKVPFRGSSSGLSTVCLTWLGFLCLRSSYMSACSLCAE